jgi:hypothetical protein
MGRHDGVRSPRAASMPSRRSATRSSLRGSPARWSRPETRSSSRSSARWPYLAAEAERTERWKHRLGRDGFRVGIAWQGNPKAPGPSRAIPLQAFRPLSRLAGVRLISLQKNDGSGALGGASKGMAVESLGADFDAGADAFLDTAAVMMNLDLVITPRSRILPVRSGGRSGSRCGT